VNSSLRETPRRLAAASARRKIWSGIEMAVFTRLSITGLYRTRHATPPVQSDGVRHLALMLVSAQGTGGGGGLGPQ
jgi:hypothetical protein